MSLFNRTVEWFVPAGLAERAPEEHRRARLSVVLLLALFPMNPVAAATYAMLGLDLFVWPVIACGFLMALCPFIIRTTGSYKLGGAIALINLMSAITLISLHTGGLNSPVLWWITPIPLLVGTVLGRRNATGWTLVSIAMVITIALFVPGGLDDLALSLTEGQQHWLSKSTLIAVVITMLSAFFHGDENRQESFDRLEQANATFKQAWDQAESSLIVVECEKQRTEKALECVRQSREELEESNRIKTEVLRMAAHDLRSPLSELSGLIELVRDEDAVSVSDRANYLTLMANTTESMRNLLDGLLHLNRIEAGVLETEPDDIDACDIFSSLARDFEGRAQLKGISLKTQLTAYEIRLSTDMTMLQQILQNLISNAIKYSPASSRVTLKLEEHDDSVSFAVEDQGPGLSKNDQEKLYRPFSRLTPQPTAGESSTGVGLSIVKSLTGLLGGEIECESQVGLGTTFRVVLPKERLAA